MGHKSFDPSSQGQRPQQAPRHQGVAATSIEQGQIKQSIMSNKSGKSNQKDTLKSYTTNQRNAKRSQGVTNQSNHLQQTSSTAARSG